LKFIKNEKTRWGLFLKRRKKWLAEQLTGRKEVKKEKNGTSGLKAIYLKNLHVLL